jgi:glycosyltransferase involved in cell wall biosynthesis
MTKSGLHQPYILSVGALEPRKNLIILLKAYSLLKTELKLVLVGRETPYAHQLKKKAEELKISHRVIFLHDVQNADMPAIYQSAGLFVFPSVFEGFGIPILEALCSSVPVITSAGSCFEETGGEASLYVNPHDPEEMADAMLNVLENKSLHDGMIEAGLQHASDFTDDKIAAKWMTLYTQMI